MLFTCVSLISFITVYFVFLSLGIVDYEYFWQSVRDVSFYKIIYNVYM